MRKALKFGLCMAMALTLVGCGTTGTNASDPEKATATEDAAAIEEAVTNESENTESEEVVYEKFFEFSSVDLDGNTVSNDIFAEKDLTVVNVWATFCGPCINEMPELGEWAKEMPDNVQIIGMIGDVDGIMDAEHVELAKQIIDETGADFTHVIAGSEDFAPFLETIDGVPTTYFVDKDGNIVAEPFVGAYVDGYKEVVQAYLDSLK